VFDCSAFVGVFTYKVSNLYAARSKIDVGENTNIGEEKSNP